jgi:predicted DsbA family dithiol-disulfide isomerase
VRLRRLRDEFAERLVIEWRAFPLRPEPDPSASFTGTYREQAWRRCQTLAQDDGVTFRPWTAATYPNWSLPALEAAKCVARQGAEAFERLHLRLYEAFFTHGRNIAVRDEVVSIVRESGADMERFAADYASGAARDEVLRDYEAARATHGVRAIPTVVVGARRLVGLTALAEYRKAAEEAGG